MGIRQTHTYVELGLSKSAYDEIAKKLKDYGHAFMDDGTIDMHGIGVTCETPDTDRIALDAAHAILKAHTDHAGKPYPQLKAAIQAIVADAMRQCQTS